MHRMMMKQRHTRYASVHVTMRYAGVIFLTIACALPIAN